MNSKESENYAEQVIKLEAEVAKLREINTSLAATGIHIEPGTATVGHPAEHRIAELEAEAERLREQLRLANVDACNEATDAATLESLLREVAAEAEAHKLGSGDPDRPSCPKCVSIQTRIRAALSEELEASDDLLAAAREFVVDALRATANPLPSEDKLDSAARRIARFVEDTNREAEKAEAAGRKRIAELEAEVERLNCRLVDVVGDYDPEVGDPLTLVERAEKAEAEVERLRETGDQHCRNAAAWIARHNALLEDQRVLRCAFCDAEYPPGTPPTQHEALTAHVEVCEQHPMREVERERDEARANTWGECATFVAEALVGDGMENECCEKVVQCIVERMGEEVVSIRAALPESREEVE